MIAVNALQGQVLGNTISNPYLEITRNNRGFHHHRGINTHTGATHRHCLGDICRQECTARQGDNITVRSCGMCLLPGLRSIKGSNVSLMAKGGQQRTLSPAHRCKNKSNERKKNLLHNNKKLGGTARGFSAQQAPPSALHKEKHEQFTPMVDVNLHRLFSCVRSWRFR